MRRASRGTPGVGVARRTCAQWSSWGGRGRSCRMYRLASAATREVSIHAARPARLPRPRTSCSVTICHTAAHPLSPRTSAHFRRVPSPAPATVVRRTLVWSAPHSPYPRRPRPWHCSAAPSPSRSRKRRLNENFVRLTFAGPDLAEFADTCLDQRIKLVLGADARLSSAGAAPRGWTGGATSLTTAPDHAPTPPASCAGSRRRSTSTSDARTSGPASHFALEAQVGDRALLGAYADHRRRTRRAWRRSGALHRLCWSAMRPPSPPSRTSSAVCPRM